MSCTGDQFITRVGAAGGGQWDGRDALANTLNINGVRYGMVHDESYASAARPAWMPVGKSTTCRAYRA